MERAQLIRDLNNRFSDAPAEEIISYFLEAYKGRIALSSSLSIEDQTLTDIIVKNGGARIFTLDTGRLFPETYQLIDKTNLTYNIKLEVFFPDYREVQRMIREEGINLFYNSIESRHRCCQIRKLEPLARAFQGLDVWICGLRREQSVTRQDMQVVEWDEMHQLIKVNPLISWTEQQVANPVHAPFNPAKMYALDDGGGNRPIIVNADCIRSIKEMGVTNLRHPFL